MSKNQTAGLWMRSIKKELDITIFKHNEVISDVTNEGHPNFSQRNIL